MILPIHMPPPVNKLIEIVNTTVFSYFYVR